MFIKKLEGFTWSLALLKTNALDKYAQGAYLLSKLHIKGKGGGGDCLFGKSILYQMILHNK